MAEENQNEGQEKSFDASEQKIQRSREKGDTAKSDEVSTVLLYAGLAIAILMFGAHIMRAAMAGLAGMLTHPEDLGKALLLDRNGDGFFSLISALGWGLAPLFLIPILAVALALIAQRAVVFAPDKIKPKLSKISLIKNAKQKYGMDGMVEFLKRLAKLSFVTVLAMVFFMKEFLTLPLLSQTSPQMLMPEIRDVTLELLLYMTIAAGVIAAIDLPYKRYSFFNKLKMTLQEVRDEMKENEGDPHLKRERRSRAEAMAKSTMLADVAGADVVIVNPTHYAVALVWDRLGGGVPTCVAKGVDEMAMRIREQADLYNVAIHSDPPCARSLYATIEIGEGILPEHYAAVAAAIHFADSVKVKAY